MAALRKECSALVYAAEELKKDKGFMMEAVQTNGFALEHASMGLKKDKDVVCRAVHQNGLALHLAASEPQNDSDVVLAAIRQNPFALSYAPTWLKESRSFLLTALRENGLAFELVGESLQMDKEVALVAVQQNGLALEHAGDELKNNLEVVSAACSQDPCALEFASAGLKDNKDLVMAAVLRNGAVLKHASQHLQMDDQLLLAAAARPLRRFSHERAEIGAGPFSAKGRLQTQELFPEAALAAFNEPGDVQELVTRPLTSGLMTEPPEQTDLQVDPAEDHVDASSVEDATSDGVLEVKTSEASSPRRPNADMPDESQHRTEPSTPPSTPRTESGEPAAETTRAMPAEEDGCEVVDPSSNQHDEPSHLEDRCIQMSHEQDLPQSQEASSEFGHEAVLATVQRDHPGLALATTSVPMKGPSTLECCFGFFVQR